MNEASQSIGIITTGSELLAGHIADENSRWLSEQVTELKIPVKFQLSCTDKNLDIKNALQFLSQYCSHIIVTGGLGPTSDDLTRDAISSFFGKTLEYSEESWEKLVALVGRPESEISETNKRQCYFPEGSHIIDNPNGTAAGFHLKDIVEVFVLPGPPRENQPMFNSYVKSAITSTDMTEDLTRLQWTLLGIPESDLATICERAFAELPVEVAYRASFPIIQLKFALKSSIYAGLQSVFNDLRRSLETYLISDQKNYDPYKEVVKHFQDYDDVQCIDLATKGFLSQKLSLALRKVQSDPESVSLLSQFERQKTDFAFVEEAYAHLSNASLLVLVAPNENDHSISYLVKTDEKEVKDSIALPPRIRKRSKDLQNQYLAFAAVKQLLEVLRELQSLDKG